SWIWRYAKRPNFDPKSILVIRKEGTLVAALVMTYGTMNIQGKQKKIALIDDVSTLPRWQRRGFATSLIDHAIGRAQEVGCWGIHLSADPDGSANRIYKNAGFETITRCRNMLGILHHRRAARFGKRRHAIPLSAMSILNRFRPSRIDIENLGIEIIEDSAASEVLLRALNSFGLQNGTLIFNDEYVKWMTRPRSDGAMKVASITQNNEFSGVFTLSSSDFSGPGGTDRMAVIGNLTLSESMRFKDAIAAALHRAKRITKVSLDCAMINMFVDSRDALLNAACKKAGFIDVGQVASMFHSLGHPERQHEIRKGIWNQPVETAKSNP
ncbi:MAG: GNAT family N-acetyltransferase, partial [Candidatus Thorarchaeota archaeon]